MFFQTVHQKCHFYLHFAFLRAKNKRCNMLKKKSITERLKNRQKNNCHLTKRIEMEQPNGEYIAQRNTCRIIPPLYRNDTCHFRLRLRARIFRNLARLAISFVDSRMGKETNYGDIFC